MDKLIKKTQQAVKSGSKKEIKKDFDTLKKTDKKMDAKVEKCDMKMKKKK